MTAPTPPLSAKRFTGWAGVLVLLVWMGIASSTSPSAIEAIEGPVPLVWLALFLLGVMGRWAPPRGATPFMRLGGVVLLAWLLASFAAASSMNWGADPWLIRLIDTFHHPEHAAGFVAIAVAMALMSSVSRRRELWVLGPVAVVSTAVAKELLIPSAVVVGGIWWAGRVLRGTATRRWTWTIVLVAALGTAPEAIGTICGWGGTYGSTVFVLFSHPLAAVVAIVAVVVCGVAGGLALRRRRIGRAARHWAVGLGWGGVVVAYVVLGGCSDIVLGAGPLLLFLAAGPRTPWSTLLWGAASVLVLSVVIAVTWGSPVHVLSGAIMIGAGTTAVAFVHRSAMARCRSLASKTRPPA
jgi:hypothetical protein